MKLRRSIENQNQTKQLKREQREDSPDPRLACCRRNNVSAGTGREETKSIPFCYTLLGFPFKFSNGRKRRSSSTQLTLAVSHMQKKKKKTHQIWTQKKRLSFSILCKEAESDLSS